MNCTDAAGQSPDRSEEIGKLAGRVLVGVAKHLAVTSPAGVLASDVMRTCVAAEAYVVAGRSAGEANVIAEAALAAVPEAPDGVTRGKYAELLREAAESLGWGRS
ncbi:hypothetical protein [Streptomyces atratus]|uniref:Uncharacterized protein n=1 Tax=Streptomyces atratus TaxID=1893 RepID=A0A2Z5J6U7_STRAR|nr:hypothetical protein [Streptomyces atratus]AXE76041.1 hypothetical protein C5746_02615 [Streptomyces atratus]